MIAKLGFKDLKEMHEACMEKGADRQIISNIIKTQDIL